MGDFQYISAMHRPVLIFDLDDTLLIQEETNKQLILAMAAENGLEPVVFHRQFHEVYRNHFNSFPFIHYCRQVGISAGEGLWGDFGGADEGHAQLRQLIPQFRREAWTLALRSMGVIPTQADIKAGRLVLESVAEYWSSEFIRRRKAMQALFPGTKELIYSLKEKYFLAILTNGATELQWFKVDSTGLRSAFDTIIVSGDYGVGKPNKAIFDILIKSFKDRADKFLMIGNSLSSDIQGAVNAGLPCVWVDRDEEKPRASLTPTAVIRDLAELPALLKTLPGFDI